MSESIVIVLAISLVSAAVGAFLLNPYNEGGSGAILGLLLGPFGALIAALMAVTEELKKQSEFSLKLAREARVEETTSDLDA